MRIFFSYLLCLAMLGIALPASQLYAQAAGSTSVQKPVYYWPISPRPVAKPQEVWITFDNIRMKTYTLTLAGEKIEIPYLGGFSIGTPEDKWSTTWVIPEQPAIKWGVAVFNRGDWMPDGNKAGIEGYLRGLALKRATQIRSTVTGDMRHSAAIMGVVPEEVSYVQDGIRHHQYIMETSGGKIWIFGYQAPEKMFDTHSDNVRVILARIAQMR